MIINGSAQVLLNLLKKTNRQSLKIDPGTHKENPIGVKNEIKQLHHFILCNVMCYGALKSNIDPVDLGQYCFSVLDNTSYPTQ
jgi:hypothetical protein